MFEDQLTGVQVYRQTETGSAGDDYTSNTITETIVLTGFNQVDLREGGKKDSIIDEFAQDVAQEYVVYFDLTAPIENGDYIRFNSGNINKNIAYIPNNGDDLILRIKNFNTGSGSIGALEAQCIAN
jgi:hypothetical protein